MTRAFFVVAIVAALLVACVDPTLADGFRRRRVVCNSTYCPPAVVAVDHFAQDVAIVADVFQEPPASAIVVQNNYNGAPLNLGSTIYGYAADPLRSPLASNPYQVDPGSVLREAARLADRSAALTSETVTAYQTLGTLALQSGAQADTIRAQTEQLRAQAELIRAATPQAIQAAPILAPQVQQVQRLTSGSQTICIEPDGRGGFSIRVEGSQAEATHAPEAEVDSSNSVPLGVRVLQQRCASCHNESNAKGELSLFSADLSTLSAIDEDLAARILDRTQAGSMPPQPEPELTRRELAALELLLAQ